MAIKINTKQFERRLDKAIAKGTQEFGRELGRIIKEKEVTPKLTGNLQKHQKVENKMRKTIRISYPDVPYASYIYENPDNLKIHQGREKDDRYRKNRNRWARDHWIEDILFNDPEVREGFLLAKYIKEYLEPELGKFDSSDAESTYINGIDTTYLDDDDLIALGLKEPERVDIDDVDDDTYFNENGKDYRDRFDKEVYVNRYDDDDDDGDDDAGSDW